MALAQHMEQRLDSLESSLGDRIGLAHGVIKVVVSAFDCKANLPFISTQRYCASCNSCISSFLTFTPSLTRLKTHEYRDLGILGPSAPRR